MDFSEYKGIYVIGALANGKIQKVTGELTGEAAYWLTSWGKRSQSSSSVPISRIRHPR